MSAPLIALTGLIYAYIACEQMFKGNASMGVVYAGCSVRRVCVFKCWAVYFSEMTLFIQNISKSAYAAGDHFACGDRAIAIEILDPCSERATPKHKFAETHTFEFLDVEEKDIQFEEFAITDQQAAHLVKILTKSLEQRRNVVVHCTAGMCRSGAVAEVGIMMGFTDTGAYRQPNMLVKSKMMKCLGWGYE